MVLPLFGMNPVTGAKLDAVVNEVNVTHQLVDAVDLTVTGSLYTTSGTTELDLGRLAHLNVSLTSGQLYSIDLQTIATRTTPADEFEFRVRQGTAVSGALLASAISYGKPNTNGGTDRLRFLWVASSTTTTTIYISAVRATGSGTMSVFGGRQTSSVLSRLGPSTRYRTITS